MPLSLFNQNQHLVRALASTSVADVIDEIPLTENFNLTFLYLVLTMLKFLFVNFKLYLNKMVPKEGNQCNSIQLRVSSCFNEIDN